jgi:hypothetical protein
MRNTLVIRVMGVLLCCGGLSRADVIQLDLFSLGMPATFNDSSPFWQTNFDLGVTFTEISHVYIDWSGAITGGLAVDRVGQQPHPAPVGILASLGIAPNWQHTDIYGGITTYPSPQPFNQLSEFVYGSMPWSELFDGQGTIGIEYQEIIMSDGWYTEHGSVTLTNATLVVDGTVIPEPTSLLLLAFGAVGPRLIRPKRHNKNSVE